MLEWMKERDYAFYVKDLVGFLRENYGYKGCDGTVRRELVRAGFRRKLVSFLIVFFERRGGVGGVPKWGPL